MYELVVTELDEYVGDILAAGMTKKALQRLGTDPEFVEAMEMVSALNRYIKPALHSFMSPEIAKKRIRSIERKVMECEQNA